MASGAPPQIASGALIEATPGHRSVASVRHPGDSGSRATALEQAPSSAAPNTYDSSLLAHRRGARRKTLRQNAPVGLDLLSGLLLPAEPHQGLRPAPVGSAMVRRGPDDLEKPLLRTVVAAVRQVDRGDLVEGVDARLLLAFARGLQIQHLPVGGIRLRMPSDELQSVSEVIPGEEIGRPRCYGFPVQLDGAIEAAAPERDI